MSKKGKKGKKKIAGLMLFLGWMIFILLAVVFYFYFFSFPARKISLISPLSLNRL